MRIRMSSGLCLFVGFVAASATACRCSEDQSGSAGVPVDAAPSVTGIQPDAEAFTRHHRDAGVEAGVDALCAAILKEEKLDESALRSDDRTSPGPRLYCASTGRAAWAVRVDPPEAGSSLRQTLIFSGEGGAHARLASTLDHVEWPPVLGRHSAAYDFDGDGIPEFFTVVPENVRTFAPAVRNFVTFKKGVISPYPTGGSFLVDGLADINSDGRPDLRVSFEVGKRTVCEKSDEGTLKVELAAHTLPDGKFSLTDDAAAGFAARRCPAMPTADAMFIPSADPSASDPRDLSTSYVTCSRLRGKSADAVVAELTAACAPNAEATKKCAGPCRHLPDAITVAKFAPLVQLKADAGPPPR